VCVGLKNPDGSTDWLQVQYGCWVGYGLGSAVQAKLGSPSLLLAEACLEVGCTDDPMCCLVQVSALYGVLVGRVALTCMQAVMQQPWSWE
jgi:hypothetical protein